MTPPLHCPAMKHYIFICVSNLNGSSSINTLLEETFLHFHGAMSRMRNV